MKINLSGFYLSEKFDRYKADQPIKEQASEQSQTHKVTPQNDPDQSEYTCEGKRIGRPSYSKISDHYKTKNLREYDRALVVLSLYLAIILSHLHFLFSFEEEDPSFHLWLYLLWHHLCLPWMHYPQSHPQTRFGLFFSALIVLFLAIAGSCSAPTIEGHN